jgi:hypothetical protein
MQPIRARLPAIILAGLAGLAFLAPAGMSLAAASPPAADSGISRDCPTATGAIPAWQLKGGKSAKKCRLVGRLVTHDGVGVRVPGVGKGVVQAESASGGASLNVRHSPEGVVTAEFEAAEPETPAPEAAAPDAATAATGATATTTTTDSACSMTAYHFNGWTWAPRTAAYFLANTSSGLPSNVSGATFLSIQKAAAAHISAAYNNCGIVFDPSLTVAFSSTTTSHSNINGATNACGTRDTRNVLDFGSLTGSTLALNCTWYQYMSGGYSKITETDTRFDNTSRYWVTTTTGCAGTRYDLLSVATHEMGHWVGLGHVADSGSNDLTMSAVIAPCNASARTLGRGDITALNIPY